MCLSALQLHAVLANIYRWYGAIHLCIVGLVSAMNHINIYDVTSLYAMGLGTVTGVSIVKFVQGDSLLFKVLLANFPQGIISLLYLTYNGMFSYQLLELEWNSFARLRKSLRVTTPAGSQRSTYFVSLPYEYSIVSFLLNSSDSCLS